MSPGRHKICDELRPEQTIAFNETFQTFQRKSFRLESAGEHVHHLEPEADEDCRGLHSGLTRIN
jgi:hypothetical protein